MLRRPAAAAAVALLAAGCAAPSEAPGAHVEIGRQTYLILPLPPEYPGDETLSQLVAGRHEGRRQVFQADLDLAPERIDVALSIPGGPVVTRIHWDSCGIRTDGSGVLPAAVEGERILAHLFLSRWPVKQVRSSLSPGASVVQNDEERVVYEGDRAVMVIESDRVDGFETTRIRNYDYGYDLTIKTVEREE